MMESLPSKQIGEEAKNTFQPLPFPPFLTFRHHELLHF